MGIIYSFLLVVIKGFFIVLMFLRVLFIVIKLIDMFKNVILLNIYRLILYRAIDWKE